MKLQFEIGEMYTYKRLQQQIGENAKSWKGEAFEPLIQRREVIILRKEGLVSKRGLWNFFCEHISHSTLRIFQHILKKNYQELDQYTEICLFFSYSPFISV